MGVCTPPVGVGGACQAGTVCDVGFGQKGGVCRRLHGFGGGCVQRSADLDESSSGTTGGWRGGQRDTRRTRRSAANHQHTGINGWAACVTWPRTTGVLS